MKILITGANGYLGHHVVEKACQLKDAEVTAVDFANNNIDKRAKYRSFDILAASKDDDLYNQLGKPEVVIHLAWKDGFNHKSDEHLKNLYSHFCFLKNLIEHGVKSVSVMGTMHEVGYWEGEINEKTPCNPLSSYGVAKNALRQALFVYAEEKDVCIKWLRAFYIIGDDLRSASLFGKISKMAAEGKKSFPFTSGENKYDFIDVDVLADQIVTASVQQKYDGIINCCTGKPIALKDKVEEFLAVHQLDIRPEYGVFPLRKYDSPAIWGNNEIINKIMEKKN